MIHADDKEERDFIITDSDSGLFSEYHGTYEGACDQARETVYGCTGVAVVSIYVKCATATVEIKRTTNVQPC